MFLYLWIIYILDLFCSPFMVPFQILLFHLDVVKDVVLVIRLLQSIGWDLVPNQFSSMVIFANSLFGKENYIFITVVCFYFIFRSSFCSCLPYLCHSYWHQQGWLIDPQILFMIIKMWPGLKSWFLSFP